jgi:hypothetical protein
MKRLLPYILLLLCSSALAESGAYRVEVVVFRNLAVIAEAEEVEELRSFSHFPALEEKPLPENRPESGSPKVPAGDLPVSYRSDLPDDLKVITDKGAQMDDVWRRLRSSKNYRPLIYSAWEQNRTDYYPPMRIHDQQIIDTQLRPPMDIMVADLSADDPLAAYRSVFYQIDGGVQLKRSRFLHLYLDLEYRELKPRTVRDTGLLGDDANTDVIEADNTETGNLGAGNTTDYQVFSLKQNRQIQTGRLQYFDTPHFGVLVLVSAIAADPTGRRD